MERQTLPDNISADERIFFNSLLDGALGNPQILSSAPTTAAGQLKENNFGFDGTNLFITLVGTTYRISLTAV